MRRSASSSWLARAVLFLPIIAWCFLLPCCAARPKGFNFPTWWRGRGIQPQSPMPGKSRGQNHDYAPLPELAPPGPPKQHYCPGCGHDYAPPPLVGAALESPGPPEQHHCPGCDHVYGLPPAGTPLATPEPPKQQVCPGCAHDYTLPHKAGTALPVP
ncbi:unnamed protein product [Triticum turgidum subsp. durum]|uniref:Uncharacterized protein n=1 Tax=Triticum turgidum subsp. durum TaxID=4567 RepID=A0A9R0R9E3_TRITD|nr:unnamed protein product [Triticum turgidum subsp. durum]